MLGVDLSGKKALVTGGSRGIGAACCRMLARAGASVGIHFYQDEAAAGRLAEELRGMGHGGAILQGDVADPAAVARIFQRFHEVVGKPDILVNSAGIWKRAPLPEMTPEALEETLAVNLKGTIYCCREAVRNFGHGGGVIVNISSTAGQRGEACHSHYAASKGGVQSFTKSLAEELAPRCRVNCVAPGWVETDMGRDVREEPARRERILAEIPLRRIATAEDVAGAVLFLASDLARHITGEILNVNGGSVRCG